MIIIDTLLAAPVRGLMFVLEKIDEAVQQEIEAEERGIMSELASLHSALDNQSITETEFDAREKKLLDRLDRLHSENGSNADGAANS